VRVITGRYKGLMLRSTPGNQVRPTQDRVRESLFSILSDIVSDARVLDLFAGFGTLGIEALSRGAQSASFVERNRGVAALLQSNIDRIGHSECKVIVAETAKALRRLSKEGAQFDLVFLDPPYNKGLVERTLEEIARSGVMAPDGRIFAEHESRLKAIRQVAHLYRYDYRRYGDTGISFFTPFSDEVT
jgi:16S rRNA (guanine966-N2)-methyltransferase